MNIAFVDYSLGTSSLDIYVSGCRGSCRGCHNPELHNFDIGDKYNYNLFKDKIKKKVLMFDRLVKHIMIFGGEPLDQKTQDLKNLLYDLQTLGLPIWLFTRFDFEFVPIFVKNTCTYIKTGEYKKELASDDNIWYEISLASSNQKIYKMG